MLTFLGQRRTAFSEESWVRLPTPPLCPPPGHLVLTFPSLALGIGSWRKGGQLCSIF